METSTQVFYHVPAFGDCAEQHTSDGCVQEVTQPSKQASIGVGMSLQLGRPRDVIIAKLSANYEVTKVQATYDPLTRSGDMLC